MPFVQSGRCGGKTWDKTMQSMTGYGRAQKRNGDFDIEVEVRSVNHRFINLKQSLPDGLSRYETDIDKLLRQRVHRGRQSEHHHPSGG